MDLFFHLRLPSSAIAGGTLRATSPHCKDFFPAEIRHLAYQPDTTFAGV
jgi:hypothetical protein